MPACRQLCLAPQLAALAAAAAGDLNAPVPGAAPSIPIEMPAGSEEEGGSGEGSERKGPPPKDERTWFQVGAGGGHSHPFCSAPDPLIMAGGRVLPPPCLPFPLAELS